MRIVIGSDHAAFAEKAELKKHLEAKGHAVADVGPATPERCDYPDFAAKVARAVAGGQAERGILVCGTGIGMAMAANRVTGVRAAPCESEKAAEMTRRHNDANVLCMGARLIAMPRMLEMADLFLATPFEGGRHAARVEKLDAPVSRAP